MNIRRIVLLCGAVVVTVLVAVTAYYLLFGGDDNSYEPRVEEATATASLPFTSGNARLIEQSLASSDKNEQMKVVVPELHQGNWEARAVLPAGANLQVNEASFHADSSGNGVVTAVASGSVQGKFIFYLKQVEGQWLVYATEQKR